MLLLLLSLLLLLLLYKKEIGLKKLDGIIIFSYFIRCEPAIFLI
jgi:hypothetical protein